MCARDWAIEDEELKRQAKRGKAGGTMVPRDRQDHVSEGEVGRGNPAPLPRKRRADEIQAWWGADRRAEPI